IDVVVPAIPELLAGVPLPDVGELMEHVEVHDLLFSGLQVSQTRDDVPRLVVDVHVHILGDDVDATVSEDLFSESVGEDRSEGDRFVQAGEHVEDRMLPGFHLAVRSGLGHGRLVATFVITRTGSWERTASVRDRRRVSWSSPASRVFVRARRSRTFSSWRAAFCSRSHRVSYVDGSAA